MGAMLWTKPIQFGPFSISLFLPSLLLIWC